MTAKNTVRILFLLWITVLYCKFFLFKNENKLNEYQEVAKIKLDFFNNNIWMPNNNVIQYSCYVFQNASNNSIVTIKSLVVLNDELANLTTIFSCIIKSIKNGKIIETPATQVLTLWRIHAKKVFCEFNQLNLISIDEISIAIVRIGDFNAKNTTKDERVLPFQWVNYQVPRIIEISQKKIQNVAVCYKYVYDLPEMLFEWVELHRNLNVSKIVLYDSGTNNGSIARLIEEKGLNWIVETRFVYLDMNVTCKIGANVKQRSIYLNICKKIASKLVSTKNSDLIIEDLSGNFIEV